MKNYKPIRYIKIPVNIGYKKWKSHLLHRNGFLQEKGYAIHDTEESCLICCNAHNKRMGYNEKQIKKIIRKFLKNENRN